jgi:hypothetical protein
MANFNSNAYILFFSVQKKKSTKLIWVDSVLLQLFSDQHKIDRSSTIFLEQHKFYNGGFSSHKIQLFSDEHKTDSGSTLFLI